MSQRPPKKTNSDSAKPTQPDSLSCLTALRRLKRQPTAAASPPTPTTSPQTHPLLLERNSITQRAQDLESRILNLSNQVRLLPPPRTSYDNIKVINAYRALNAEGQRLKLEKEMWKLKLEKAEWVGVMRREWESGCRNGGVGFLRRRGELVGIKKVREEVGARLDQVERRLLAFEGTFTDEQLLERKTEWDEIGMEMDAIRTELTKARNRIRN